MTLACLALAVWIAWRYSRLEIDPDWAMFNLVAFTGAWYGRDFLDCKSPAVHLWYWAIAKVVGANITRVRFAHHLLISLPGVVVGGWSGLAFIVMVNSGWMIAFHGNVGQVPAGLFLLAYVWNNPWGSTALIAIACFYEPKLIPAGVLFLVLSQWWPPLLALAAAGGGAAGLLYFLKRQWWDWLWEANVVTTRRMARARRTIPAGIRIDFTTLASRGMMYLLPWLGIAVMERPDWRYWLPAAAYAVFIALGVAVRDNHFLPLAPWIVLALPVWAAALFVAVELLSGFCYLGDTWGRYYGGLAGANRDARQVGEFLRDKPGRVWVNGLHSAVYIHARKAPLFGLCEQIEIREVSPERREKWRAGFRSDPPEWIVVGYQPGWTFNGRGYKAVAETEYSKIYRRM